MDNKSAEYFDLLKKRIVQVLRQSYPGISESIQEWKGQTISFFQEDLMVKVNDSISEKWFYNHLKSKSSKLPRIDILNLLSRYVGYNDWQDFVYQNRVENEFETSSYNPNRIFVIVPVVMLVILILFYFVFRMTSNYEYQFCFVNSDSHNPIEFTPVSVVLLNDGESPRILNVGENGCLKVKTERMNIRFAVNAPYYRDDTIERSLKRFDRIETIPIRTDDYALMIDLFSTGKILDWKKRRKQLDDMIAENARIFEVLQAGERGVELYDKWEFIDMLTVPSSSLKHIQILDTEYLNNRITGLRFTTKKLKIDD
jgi:hypothetical protein